MRFTVLLSDPGRASAPAPEPLHVEADEHTVEGAHHVFRRDTTVLGRPRSVVALRLPVDGVVAVRADGPHESR